MPHRRVVSLLWAAVLFTLPGCGAAQPPDSVATASPSGTGSQTTGGVFDPNEIEVALPDSGGKSSVEIQAAFINRGDVPLNVVEIKTSCACTMAGDLPTSTIAPGEEIQIPLEVIPPTHGSKSAKVVAVTSPPSPDAALMILAKGQPRQPPFYEATPAVVNFAHTAGQPFSGTARFFCVENPKSPPWVESVTIDGSANEGLTAELQALPDTTPYPGLDGVRRGYEVTVTADNPDAAIEDFHAVLQCRSEADSESPRRIRFNVNGTPIVRPVPEIIRWPLPIDASKPTRTLILSFAESKAWKVEVRDVPDWLSVNLHPPTDEAFAQLRLELRADPGPRDPASVELELSVSAAGQEPVVCRVPVSFVAT